MRRFAVLTLATAAAALGTWFAGMRAGWPPLVDFHRRFNRDHVNPRMLEHRGVPGAPTAVVQHTGRTSGAHYRTPVGARRTEDGFVIASVYGRSSDWIRNVLAGGPSGIEWEGDVVEVADPRLVPIADAAQYFPRHEQVAHRLFGVTEALRLRVAP